MGKISFRKKISSIVVLLIAGAAGGCATMTNELRVGKLTPNQRIYVGRINVKFGDTAPNDLKCEIYINSDIVPAFKLSSDGYFFYKTDRAEAELSRITCYHRANYYLAAWHQQKFPLKPFYRPENQKEAVYFGEVNLIWDFDKSKTIPAAERLPLTSEPPREAHIYNSGTIAVEVKSEFEVMSRLFYEKVEGARENGFEIKEHLVQTKL